jgi:hypothetical protein
LFCFSSWRGCVTAGSFEFFFIIKKMSLHLTGDLSRFRAYLTAQHHLTRSILSALSTEKGKEFRVVVTGLSEPHDPHGAALQTPLLGVFHACEFKALLNCVPLMIDDCQINEEEADAIPATYKAWIQSNLENNACAHGARIALAHNCDVVAHVATYTPYGTSDWDLLASDEVQRLEDAEYDALWDSEVVSELWHVNDRAVAKLVELCM